MGRGGLNSMDSPTGWDERLVPVDGGLAPGEARDQVHQTQKTDEFDGGWELGHCRRSLLRGYNTVCIYSIEWEMSG